MKPVLTYLVVFVLSLSASVLVHQFMGADESSGLSEGMNLTQADIERMVKLEFEDQQRLVMNSDSTGSQLFLGPLERDLADLQQRQNELLKKIESMMNNDPLAKVDAADVKILDGVQLDEVVSSAIVRYEEQQRRDQIERAAERRRERDAARRVELEKNLTDKLRLVGDQPARVMAVIDQIDDRRNAFFEDMRAARESGDMAQMDWTSMREEFTKMQETIDTDVKNILNADQVPLYEEYKKESPWTFGGNNMMRMGGRQRGGDAGGFGGGFGGGNGRGGNNR